MSLESGLYIIENRHNLVGRALHEDLSLLPKTVFANTDNRGARWRVEYLGDDKYKLFASGDVTGINRGTVAAFLLEEEQQTRAETWIITARPQMGEILYTIETESHNGGWVATDEETTPVRVKPLIVVPTFPPRFPISELFEFIRLDRDD